MRLSKSIMVNAAWDAASIASESFSSTSTGDNSDESFEDSSSEEESSGSEDETENDDSSYAYSSDQAGFDDEPVVGGGTSKQEDIESGYGSTPTTSQKEESKIKRSKAVKVVASLCCFCIILVVILGSVLGIKKKDDNNGPTMAPTTLPITTPSTIPTRLFPTPPPEPSISMPTTTNLEDPEEFLLVASGDNYFDGSSNSASQINNGDLDTLLLRRNGFVMIEYNVSELAAIILDATTIPDDTRVPSAILRLVPVRGSDDGAANITVASLLVALPAPLETLHNSFPLPPNGSMSPKPAVHSILDISASTIVDIDITSFLFPPIPLEEEEEEDAIIRRMQQKAVTFLDHLTFVLQLTDTSGSIVFESRESSGNGPEIIISLRPASWNSHNTCESYHALLQGDPTTTTTTTTNSNSNSNNISSVVARGNTLEDGVEKSPDGRPTPVDYFVSSDSNTEHVILPQPPAVNWQEFDNRTDCPHEDPNAVSWFTEFPSLSPGDNVAIPDNTIMIIDKSIRTILGIITIPSNSTLVFAEDPSGITMDIQGMIVQGSLIAGSEGCRYETPLAITLHGSRPSQEDITDDTLPKSYKGIDIDGGTLQLHGKRYYRTWTR